MNKTISAILLLLFSIPLCIFSGFVISQMWLWFIVPLGLAAISIPEAIGIDLLLNLMLMRPNMARDPHIEGWTLSFATFVAVLFFWGFGAIVHMFM